MQSGLPEKFWGYALDHFVYNDNRVKHFVNGELQPSYYEQAFEKEPLTGHLVPFGQGVAALFDNIPNSDKFTARGYEAIIIGYGPVASYKVIAVEDLEKIQKQGGRLTVGVTRDVRIRPTRRPWPWCTRIRRKSAT